MYPARQQDYLQYKPSTWLLSEALFVELVQNLLCHLAMSNQAEHREMETSGSKIAGICR